jgi:hypothetical protein
MCRRTFRIRFNALDKAGMDVGSGGRFSRVPRADLGNWSNTTPLPTTGPNAEACNVCHIADTIGRAGDGSNPAGLSVIRDPLHGGTPVTFIQRNTPHLFTMAGLQLLVEEMNAEIEEIVDSTTEIACRDNEQSSADLTSKGIYFGSATVTPPCASPAVQLDVEGIDTDLIAKPYQWKGSEPTIRAFSRDAFHNELGMDPVELTGDVVDGEFDNVSDEVSIADITAMTIYPAAQPRPTSMTELDALRRTLGQSFGRAGRRTAEQLGLPSLSPSECLDIARGGHASEAIGCAQCHVPTFTITDPGFDEPSANSNYRDSRFPAGQTAMDPSAPGSG